MGTLFAIRKKGFRILVHASIFNMEEGSEKLPAYYGEFHRLLAKQLNLKLIDPRCYHANRLWRIPNSIHSDTGLHKVRLTTRELLSLSPSEIMQLAKTTRPDPPLEPSTVRVRMEIFEKARNVVEERDSKYARENLGSNPPSRICIEGSNHTRSLMLFRRRRLSRRSQCTSSRHRDIRFSRSSQPGLTGRTAENRG